MNVPNNLTSILSVLSIVLSVVGLVFSPASAAVQNPPSIDGSGMAAHGYGIHGIGNATWQAERMQTTLTQLGQQGVDVSQAQADLASGNTTAAVQWLRKYIMANPGVAATSTRSQGWSSTAQTGRLQTELTKLSQQGVDVSQAQADLTAGNTTAAFQWIHEYLKANPGALGNKTGSQSARSSAWKGGPWFAGHRPVAGSTA